MTRQSICIGKLYAEFLAVGDYDNARAALDEFRAAKGEQRYGNDNNRIYGNGDLGNCGIRTVLREYGRA